MKSSAGQNHSILIPSIKPGSPGELSLRSADFDGWMVTPGDTLLVDAPGQEAAVLEVTEDGCAAIDNMKSLQDEIPCVIFVRKASFSSNFVLRVANILERKIRITEFQSPAGTIQSPIEIEPNSEAEIGWCELSKNRNLTAGENFLIKVQGFREIQGVVAEGQLKGGGGIWKAAAAAAGGILLGTLGG